MLCAWQNAIYTGGLSGLEEASVSTLWAQHVVFALRCSEREHLLELVFLSLNKVNGLLVKVDTFLKVTTTFMSLCLLS